jgi:hypothetical protein
MDGVAKRFSRDYPESSNFCAIFVLYSIPDPCINLNNPLSILLYVSA